MLALGDPERPAAAVRPRGVLERHGFKDDGEPADAQDAARQLVLPVIRGLWGGEGTERMVNRVDFDWPQSRTYSQKASPDRIMRGPS